MTTNPDYAFSLKARMLARELLWFLVAVALGVAVGLAALGQTLPSPSPALDYTPTTPGASVMQQTTVAAPELLSVERHATHCTITWACSPDAMAFQLMRRTGSVTNIPFAQRIERQDTRQSFTVADPTRVRFTYVDKRLHRDPTYFYSVIVVAPANVGGVESNVLQTGP